MKRWSDYFMKHRFIWILTVLMMCLFFTGCMSHIVKHPGGQKTEIITENTHNTEELALDSHEEEIPADAELYSEEEAVLSAILNYYDEAMIALDNNDFSYAEAQIDSAAILSASIDISSITEESLALRYVNTLSTLFQKYGKIYQEGDVEEIEETPDWLDMLSETDAEDFKKGQWKDQELRQIIEKINLSSDLPIDCNDNVIKAVRYFQTVNRKAMKRWIRRSGRYMPMIHEVLEESGLPVDLFYHCVLESGLSPKAYSSAHCSGLWQFSSSTGRMYGLTRTHWYDERRDPVKSTKAAARYLKDLYKIYGDWRIVLAAYNWGPTGVNRQLKKGKTDFWEMRVPRETRNHVSAFMALIVISKAPELFGYDHIEKEPVFDFDVVELPYTNLRTAAKCAGVDYEVLKDLNTELRRGYTPSGMTYSLRIPAGTKEQFLAEYARLPKEKYTPQAVDTYYVRKGDTLSGIAESFHVSVDRIVDENNIRNRNRLSVGQPLRIPGRHSASTATASTTTATKQTFTQSEIITAEKNAKTYKVRRNDSLSTIAARHGTNVSMIQALNNMGGKTRIVPGQTLKIPVEKAADSISLPSYSKTIQRLSAATIANSEVTYVIQRNDTLYEIAKKYNVSYRDIMRWNKIKDHRRIKPGQKITIKTKG